MTICISAIGKDEKNNEEFIIFSTDHMISLVNIGQEFECTMDKHKRLNSHTCAMLSGNPTIFNKAIENVTELDNFESIISKIENNLIKIKNEMTQRGVLDKFQINFNYIKEELKKESINPNIQEIIEFIKNFRLDTSILIIGFSEGKARISEVSEIGSTQTDDLGFGVIGSGGNAGTFAYGPNSPLQKWSMPYDLNGWWVLSVWGNDATSPVGTMTEGNWHFVCGQHDGTTTRLWINGLNRANVTKTLNPTEGLSIGYRWYADDNVGNINNTGIFSLTTSGSECSPTLNVDWDISDSQVCDAKSVTTGTGSINILSGGTLYLINSANIITNQLNLKTTGDQVFINSGSEIRVG